MKSNLTKFAQAAGVMLAMALTLSCSSNDEGNNNGGTSSGSDGGSSSPSGGGNGIVACKVSNAGDVAGNVVCEELEVPADNVEKVKAQCINDEILGGEVLSSCPSGYTETCERSKNKVDKQTLYVYFNIPNGKVCKDYFL